MISTTHDIYSDPDVPNSLGSFEGMTTDIWPPVAPSATHVSAFERLGQLLPGLLLAAGVAWLGAYLSQWVGVSVLGLERSPISGLMMAICVGLVVRNALGLPTVYTPGIRICVSLILRLGVALLGMRLSLAIAGAIGLAALPCAIGGVVGSLLLVSWIGRRAGLSWRLSALIAVGTGICGVSAIVATASVVDAEEDEISYAAATITLFGMIGMMIYPFLAYSMFPLRPELAGCLMGTGIHDTAQVVAAGMIYQQLYSAPQALNAAVVTKLMRNLCLIAAVPAVAWMHHHAHSGETNRPRLHWRKAVPLFIIGFIGLVLLRSLGDAVTVGSERIAGAWTQAVSLSQIVAGGCLALAMASVGLNTDLKRLVRLGIRPLLVGFAAALIVGLIGLITIGLFTRFLIPVT